MAEYKDVEPLKKQIADFKQVVNSQNSDYLTGYISALSATEGIIAALPAADVVEVVRCKDCKYFQTAKVNNKGFLICPASGMEITETDYCSYGKRKMEDTDD